MSDARTTMGNAAYSGIGLYAEYAAGLAISVIVARKLGPEHFGTYTLLMWFGAVGVTLSTHGITTGVMKFVGEARGQGAPALVHDALRYFERMQVWSVVGVCAALAAVSSFFADRVVADSSARQLLWLVLPAVALRSMFVFWASVAKGFEAFAQTARVLGFVAPLSVVVVLCVGRWGGSLGQFVSGYTLICLLYALAMGHAARRIAARNHEARSIEPPITRMRRHVAYALAIVTFEMLILRQTELLFLDRYSTPEDVAYFGIGRSMSATAMLLVPGVATALLLPMTSRTFGENPVILGPRFLSATRYILILTVPVVVLCEIFAADMITLLYGTDYGPAVMVFRVSVAAAAVGVASASASSYQLSADHQPAIVTIMALTSAITLVLDWLLIRAHGLQGATAAAAVGSVLLGAGLLWHAARTLRVRFDSFTYARVLAAGLVAAVPAMLLRATLPLWLALPVGVILVPTVYLALTVVLGGWTPADVQSMRAFIDAVPRQLGRPLDAFLRWAASTTLVPRETDSTAAFGVEIR